MVDSREGSATVAVANSGRDDIAQRLHLVLGEQLGPIRSSPGHREATTGIDSGSPSGDDSTRCTNLARALPPYRAIRFFHLTLTYTGV